MKKFLLYRLATKEIVSISSSPIRYDAKLFGVLEKDFTKEELQTFQEAEKKVVTGKDVEVSNPTQQRQKDQEAIKNKLEALRGKLDEPGNSEAVLDNLIDFINTIIQ